MWEGTIHLPGKDKKVVPRFRLSKNIRPERYRLKIVPLADPEHEVGRGYVRITLKVPFSFKLNCPAQNANVFSKYVHA